MGIVHVIDSFLTLPANVSTTAVAANLTSAAGALTAAELVETVDTTPDVTIFAPNNAAFQAIGSALGNISTADLASVLTYHVVAGTIGYSSMLTNTSLETVNGANLTITVNNGTVYVNSAMVVTADVLVANGVVHVIDNVLNPANATATPDPAMSTQMPAFSGASSATNVPFTSGVPTPTAPVGGGETAMSSSSASGQAMPMRTGAVGAAALFGGAALVYNM
jgi:Fasciclin domain